MNATNLKVDDENVLAKLPEPKGYKLLIAIPELHGKSEGGVYMPDSIKHMEETASIIGYVISVGTEAYTDKDRFPNGHGAKKVILSSSVRTQVRALK